MQKTIVNGTAIYQVTKEVVDGILENQSGIEKYGEPHELLWYYDEQSGKYVGCDNLGACAWMEDFDTYDECEAWLLGADLML